MTTPHAFILARVSEIEAEAERASSFTPWTDDFQRDNYGHLTIQPTFVLGWCAALRAVVELHGSDRIDRCLSCLTDRVGYSDDWMPDDHPCSTLRALAAIWSTHADYDARWAE